VTTLVLLLLQNVAKIFFATDIEYASRRGRAERHGGGLRRQVRSCIAVKNGGNFGSVGIGRMIHGERRQAFAAQAMFIFPAQFFSRPWSELHLKTSAAIEGRSAAKWITAGFT